MTAALEISLPIADHGDIVSTLPFFLPVLLIVGGLLVMRAIERKRDTSSPIDE
ncbi:MAG: hypothetical protein M3383_07480 [Actinomycetota bacterium]|nr:hypothetical protein [Actinomycetota bacterium]